MTSGERDMVLTLGGVYHADTGPPGYAFRITLWGFSSPLFPPNLVVLLYRGSPKGQAVC